MRILSKFGSCLGVDLSLDIGYGSILDLSSLSLLSSQQYQLLASKGITCQSGVFGGA